MDNKTVIFIGGSSYSGSTLLDMVLANSPAGFSCGELTALFNPYRDHHIEHRCGCGSDDCSIWETIKKCGAKKSHQAIFELFKDVDYIVDSSKDPLWIYDRTKDLEASGITVKNILIWKTPEEYYESKKKRRKALDWRRSWVNYHRLYFRLVKNWAAIQYKRLVTDPASLEQVCMYLGVPYSARQFEFWEKKHHTLFGNTSAKIHLYSKAVDKFQECSKELIIHDPNAPSIDNQDDRYRSIYYRAEEDKFTVKEGRLMKQIVDALISRDVGMQLSAASIPQSGLEATAFLYYVRRIKLRTLGLALRAKRIVLCKENNMSQ